MTRADFVAKYFPRYVEPYRINYGIRLRPDGRPTHPTNATAQAQNTKRANVIDAAYANYRAMVAEVRALRARQTANATA